MLAAEGFQDARPLAKKTTTLYSLMELQLSKQDHYDFGLRSLRGVLVCAGTLKREAPELSEELILLRALRDMNVPKFIREDAELFRVLLADLFPGVELPVTDYGQLQVAIERELERAGLQKHSSVISKSIQLYESKLTRHCNMLVGHTLSGKSTAWKALSKAFTALNKEDGRADFNPCKTHLINPKAVSMNELYGAYDLTTMEWTDGVLSTVFRNCANNEKEEEQWIMLDGPVDTLWIESMNTVMDDNRTLTLINGDRIGMSAFMSLVFEVQDLSVASPATVSRAGMIYFDVLDLGWWPFVDSWLAATFAEEDVRVFHRALFDKYVVPLCAVRRKGITELVPITDFHAVRSLCNLYGCFAKNKGESGLDREADAEGYFPLADKWFTFACIWSLGAAADEAGRVRLDAALRDIEAQFPPPQTVYEYWVDPKTKDWKLWEEKVPQGWKPPRNEPFFKITVPTVDTVRNQSLMDTLWKEQFAVLIVGDTGTGKTVVAQKILNNLPNGFAPMIINMSSATTSVQTQHIIEGGMEKRSKDKLGPSGGKRMLCFVDDLNMPQKDTYGSQPPLELLRQWIDYGGWYEREKQSWRNILDMQLIAAMGPPGGGRSQISERLQSRFNLINFTFPADSQLRRIFESILAPKLSEFDEEIKNLAGKITEATVAVYNTTVLECLPTPSKCHYLFNMRDIAKVVQGILKADKHFVDTREGMLRLWVHECSRVFSDRMVEHSDCDKFRAIVDTQLGTLFDVKYDALMDELQFPERGPMFVDFLSDPVGDSTTPPYEEVTDMPKLKAFVEEQLDDYNIEPGFIPMDLVLFQDAIGHIARIKRILASPRGNAMLVGVGGSGRQSLTRLSAFMAQMKTFQIEITKKYRILEFREDMKILCNLAGCEDTPMVFLFNDTQIKEEAFLEDVNNMLTSGEIPNLYGKDELPGILDGIRPLAKKNGIMETAPALWGYFVETVRKNLHVVLCMSPVGEAYRNRVRMFPGLVNCTTIDYFFLWPADALQEVAQKFLETAALESEEIKSKVARLFASTHLSVQDASAKMLAEYKRNNYVTPTNYLELVKSYISTLGGKLHEVGDARNKLKNGLEKLDSSRIEVEAMSVELEQAKVTVAKSSKDCEELLVVIVQERRAADEQKKSVEADTLRIGGEAVECEKVAADSEADLAHALPALEQAMQEVDKLNRGDIAEIKGSSNPLPIVVKVLSAMMVIFRMKTDFATAKLKVSETNFLQQIKTFDKDEVSTKTLSTLKKYTSDEEFTPAFVKSKSVACAALCTWVLAIELYSNVFRKVAPKKAALKAAMTTLAVKQEGLKEAQEKLEKVLARVAELGAQYDESQANKNALKQQAEDLENKLTRASELVNGLSGERERWEINIVKYEAALIALPGDSLVGAAFMSYAGPFDGDYRHDLVTQWLAAVKEMAVPYDPAFDFTGFMSKPTDVREWNIQGLPADDFSTENGVIVTRSSRWPLMIDPQGQANKWIKAMEEGQLKVCDLKMKDFLRHMENAIMFGQPYLMQDILEELDPSLEPVLGKQIIKQGTREVLRLGDKELDYSHDFKFYMTTRLGNPHYTPEISTKVTICNFSVKQEGLEQQLLGIVVQQEEERLELRKSELVVEVAQGTRKLVDLENELLRLLSSVEGSLLDDLNLVNTLNQSKDTSAAVKKQLLVAEETNVQIDQAREGYRPVAARAALLYFVLNDLALVDPMYQFSLDAYNDLFLQSIIDSRQRMLNDDDTRISSINTHHTEAVYTYTCRGLFERHKLLFSFQMCVKKMEQEGKIAADEYSFCLRGGTVMDRSAQRSNPAAAWISEIAWDNITEADNLESFRGLADSFEQSTRDWKAWYMSSNPELTPLPGEWDNKLDHLQHIIILRSLRPDRALAAASTFVSAHLGAYFIDPPPFDLDKIFLSSYPKLPLIFVLSPGVDPINQVKALADIRGVVMQSCSLGQGQDKIATKMIEDGLREGQWVFLANCHLSISWMPSLEKIIENYCDAEEDPHPDFRLWLSSSPNPKFPIAILQRGLKMTTEPPSGLRQNLARLYNMSTEEQFNRCHESVKYKKLMFSLCWFHAVLLERRKFKSLGWNVPYEFNDSDFSICENILAIYLDEYPEKTPFDALKYLIAMANYGGRVTDSNDRRLVNTYCAQFFCEDALAVPNYPMSDLPTYYVPEDTNLDGYKAYIKKLPMTDQPAAFGQHPNAEIAAMMMDTDEFLDTLVSLQPAAIESGGESADDRVLRLADDLAQSTPSQFDIFEIKQLFEGRSDPDPLKSTLFQELDRYNQLLLVISTTLRDLSMGIQGFVVITSELEEIFASLLNGKVPTAWAAAYPSLKPLGSWMRDMQMRCEQMETWSSTALPKVYWLSGFTYPTGFLTAILQTSARKNGVSIDTLSWEFPVITQDPSTITQHPKEGAYVRGMYLEGACWDYDHASLTDANPMELVSHMPMVHFKPMDSKKKASKSMYSCPLYLYPLRTGSRERPSYMTSVDLRCGNMSADFWIRRGTALLLATGS